MKKNKLFVVEDHHEVLPIWKEISHDYNGDLITITLDHHTDSLPAFTHQAELLSGYEIKHPEHFKHQQALLHEALLENAEVLPKTLRHDEHIDLAIQRKYIKQSAIFAPQNFSINTSEERIWVITKDDITLEERFANALESDFLQWHLDQFFKLSTYNYKCENFILDIDLDNFKFLKATQPKDDKIFKSLIENSVAITVSMERDWVRLLSMDYDNVTADELLTSIKRYI